MRLTRLYLAGFKSFASPTEIRLPEGTLAIVGPNGCGKSNLIDALRWVMGESSARHLRGQALDDLIFAGSGDRSAAGRATVELTLDNSERRIHGPFAAYNELTVRRSLDRDGQSRYEINNTRVRRRDVVDLFLGTGVGARSYSVIEQGQVNRIVDAKPDELRGYLEEAAGISVYRERRRETANRITHTEENLARLSDIAAELERQEASLARQARAARRYRELAAERRVVQVEAAAVSLLQARAERERLDAAVEAARREEAAMDATLAETETVLERAERAGQAAADRLAEQSGEKYRLSTELGGLTSRIAELDARVEGIERQERHDRETRETRETERRQAEVRRERLQVEQREQRDSLDALAADHERARERRADAEAELEARRREVMAATEARVEPEREQARLAERCEATGRECRRLESAPAAGQLVEAERELEEHEQRLQAQAAELDSLAREHDRSESALAEQARRVEQAEAHLQAAEEARRECRHEVDGVRAEIKGLDRLLAGHDGGRDDAGNAARRLVDHLVEAELQDPWIGHVLGEALEAELVADLSGHAGARIAADDAPTGWWLEAGDEVHADWLLERVRDFPGRPVESLEAALAQRDRLEPGDFLVTPEGWWVGRHWLGRAGEGQAAARLAQMARRRELRASLESLERGLSAAETTLTEAREALRAERRSLDECRAARDRATRELESRRLAHEHAGERRDKAVEAIERWRQLAEAEAEELAEARRNLGDLERRREQAREAVAEADARREQVTRDQEQARQALESAREAARSAADRFHRARREIEQRDEAIGRLAGEIQRLGHEREALDRRLADAERERRAARTERQTLSEERERLQTRLAEAERGEAQAREAQQSASAEQVAARERVAEARTARDAARAKSEQARIERAQGETREQHAVTRLEEARAQLGETESEPDVETVEHLAAEPGIVERQREQLETLDAQIRRLGAVNLSAIDDHREVEQRREELAAQIEDVESALAQLAEAIATMDRQTRERFTETFHAVNDRLGPRFASLFGGGEARLELTGDDPLDAGVALMARPPGKRISHLSLLSGGERALTATALIFAIFELNPAPFCILDEVDAPLDEANVGRFCAMVSAMSDRVQFMYITHNKTTMASASALVGVTMREAGVSRIVSVDVDAAVDLIET
ncbi:MAG: AAA family ATPase [Pseudomonadota bacterium]